MPFLFRVAISTAGVGTCLICSSSIFAKITGVRWALEDLGACQPLMIWLLQFLCGAIAVALDRPGRPIWPGRAGQAGQALPDRPVQPVGRGGRAA